MKKILYISLCLLASGCQKELSMETTEPGIAGSREGLLEKVEVVSMPQNQVYLSYLFEYEDGGKTSRITMTYTSPSGGSMVTRTGTTQFLRDAQGRSTVMTFTPDSLATQAVFNYIGNTIKLNYVKLVKKLASGDVVIDSLVYTYLGQQVSRTDQFNAQPNGQLKKTGYQEYSWDSKGNLLSKQTYHDNDGDGRFEASIKYSWAYDNNPNPRQFNDPAISYWSYLWPTGMSANNVIKQMNDYPPNGGPDDELNYVFQYNTDNRPTTETQDLSGSITKYTYYK